MYLNEHMFITKNAKSIKLSVKYLYLELINHRTNEAIRFAKNINHLVTVIIMKPFSRNSISPLK
ncbi:hypothetical protein Avbf_10851 [Armadillidium vulgare]|nr:hypothetical protein Avbf_10851 [Armadillidium vulgare]